MYFFIFYIIIYFFYCRYEVIVRRFLVRKNKEAQMVAERLRREEIPFYSSGTSFYNAASTGKSHISANSLTDIPLSFSTVLNLSPNINSLSVSPKTHWRHYST